LNRRELIGVTYRGGVKGMPRATPAARKRVRPSPTGIAQNTVRNVVSPVVQTLVGTLRSYRTVCGADIGRNSQKL
jgi:hypothetical protein